MSPGASLPRTTGVAYWTAFSVVPVVLLALVLLMTEVVVAAVVAVLVALGMAGLTAVVVVAMTAAEVVILSQMHEQLVLPQQKKPLSRLRWLQWWSQ